MNYYEKVKKGTEVTITIPFTYTIGEEGVHTNKVLKTEKDVQDEFYEELNSLDFFGHLDYKTEIKKL